jgi:hypothetical protein
MMSLCNGICLLIGILGVESNWGTLDTAATIRPIVPVPGDYDDGQIGGMIGWQGKPKKYSEKT